MKRSISRTHGVLPAVIATFCLGAGAPAEALVLDPTAFIEFTGVTGPDNITVSMNGTNDLLAESVTNTQSTPFGGTGKVTATTSNIQPLKVRVETELEGGKSGGGGTARIEFQFAVDGPDPGGGFRVPVDITSKGDVHLEQGQGSGVFGGTAGQVSARLEIYEGASFVGNLVASKSCSFDSSDPDNCSETAESFDFMITRDLLPNFIYEGVMEVAIHGQGGGAGYFVDAWGEVDPIITINPLFPDIGDYDLVFSPGTVPAGQSIPEPATIALFGAGLVGLGLLRRRRWSKGADES